MSTFAKDKQFGKIYEKIALTYFKYRKLDHPPNYNKTYDFMLDNVLKIEVKSDRRAWRTGNLAIEYSYRGEVSGIYATEAEYYMYFIIYPKYYECYKIPVNELKAICEKVDRTVKGGDNNASKMFLIKVDTVKQYFIGQFDIGTNSISPRSRNRRIIEAQKEEEIKENKKCSKLYLAFN